MRSRFKFFREKYFRPALPNLTPPPKKPSPSQRFLSNAPTNSALALATVPSEGLALQRIMHLMGNPHGKPLSYSSTIKKIGLKGLWAGAFARTAYCLSGNFATVQGVDYFGSDYQGLFMTAVSKNIILPIFLISNARQLGMNGSGTVTYVSKNILNPVVHASFCFRNLVANACLLPGFYVRDFCVATWGDKNAYLSTLLGLGTSVTVSTIVNAGLKPFFTGVSPLDVRCRVAVQVPAKLPLLVRELCSSSLVFFNTSSKANTRKSEQESSNHSHHKR